MSDDEDDDASIGISKYPVMPSLVALQQMKNRLHLARMGKKLMKWRALATGRALRKLALELNSTYAHYKDDVAAAFIALARARFHNENLNNIVLNNVADHASVTIQLGNKNTAGVKLIQHTIVEDNTSPYMFLGIEKGGQVIDEAKKAWLDLLRCMVSLVQERSGFSGLDEAHRNANKKCNVLDKLVIPRIHHTIIYIKSELEEKEREETFRLKRFKQSKQKKMAGREKKLQEETKTSSSDPCVCLETLPVCPKSSRMNSQKQLIKKESVDHYHENDQRVCELLSHIDELLDLTDKIKREGVLTESIEKFIETCKRTKIKLKANEVNLSTKSISDASLPAVPALCSSHTDSLKSILSNKSGNVGDIPQTPVNETICSRSEELGYFESRFEEITKITRTQNVDGTITEERKVITVQVEKKNPSISQSFREQKFIGACTCEGHNRLKTALSDNNKSRAASDFENLNKKYDSIQHCIDNDGETLSTTSVSNLSENCTTCLKSVSSHNISHDTCNEAPRILKYFNIDIAKCTHNNRFLADACQSRSRFVSTVGISEENSAPTQRKPLMVNKSIHCKPNCDAATKSCFISCKDVSVSTTDIACSRLYAKSSTEITKKRKAERQKEQKLKSLSYCTKNIKVKPRYYLCENETNIRKNILNDLNKLCGIDSGNGIDQKEVKRFCRSCLLLRFIENSPVRLVSSECGVCKEEELMEREIRSTPTFGPVTTCTQASMSTENTDRTRDASVLFTPTLKSALKKTNTVDCRPSGTSKVNSSTSTTKCNKYNVEPIERKQFSSPSSSSSTLEV